MKPTCLTMVDQQRSVLGSPGYPPYGWVEKRGTRQAYCGQARDQLTGHYHLGNGHRTFNPFVMRFNSPDRLSPFGAGGINAYAYCNGDPINFYDPNGTDGFLVAVNLFIAASAAKKVKEEVQTLFAISMVESRRNKLIGMGYAELAGEGISNVVKKGHKASLGANLLKAGAGSAVGAIVKTSAEDPASSSVKSGLLTGGVFAVHVATYVLESMIPKPRISYEDQLTALDAHLAGLSQDNITAPANNSTLRIVAEALARGVGDVMAATRGTDTVDGAGHERRRNSAPAVLNV